jgi:NAD(P) transhydrogenase subunit beta
MDRQSFINLAYLAASVLFIFGLKGLTHPRTAVRGNGTAALGMLVAVVAVLLSKDIVSYTHIVIGLVIGAGLGAMLATFVQMTQMPQMVAILNGFGGAASVLIVASAVVAPQGGGRPGLALTIPIAATALIGSVTLWGSLVAAAKLQELKGFDINLGAWQKIVNGLLTAACLGLGAWFCHDPGNLLPFWLLCGVASVLGITMVTPIGGADMPVVVALMNSYSGLAGAAAGFALGNNVLIIAGSLVGASGLILTSIMCKAMNRSLANVLFSVMGPTSETASADEVYGGKVKATTPDEVAMMLDGVQRVVFVPGYGLAVAHAQHAVRDLANLLAERGAEIEYAIHPVAGRMPGHMNVLLAEADVPYDQLKEMEVINPTMATVDVAIVIGANDVVNPVARTDPTSPIAGMPIIDVDKARSVVVIKRSLSPGFAGIPNPLFAAANTVMMYGDGREAIMALIQALKEG